MARRTTPSSPHPVADAHAEAERAKLYGKLRSLACEMRVLPNTGTLADLWASGALGGDPSRCVLALDFDQTLTQVDRTAAVGEQLKMRGGEAARRALHEMHAAGVTLLIITAQAPSVQTILNLMGELKVLGVHSLFGLEAVEEPSVVTLEGGIKIARMGNLMAARYNKPEALQYWLTQCAPPGKPPPTQLAFVDDNSDNAVSMFMQFAAVEITTRDEPPSPSAATEQPPQQPQSLTHSPPCIPICAVWYPPPVASKGEAFDEATRELLLSVSRGEIAHAGGISGSGGGAAGGVDVEGIDHGTASLAIS